MEITTPAVEDAAVAEQMFNVRLAAHEADQPDNPRPCGVGFPIGLRQTHAAAVKKYRVAWVDGRPAGFTFVMLPTKDNLHLAEAEVTVHPDFRRRGIGTALLREVEAIARADGRRTVLVGSVAAWSDDGPKRSEAGRRFLEAQGYRLVFTEQLNRMDLTALDPAIEQRLYDESLAASEEYETVAWTGRIPDEVLDSVAAICRTIIDEVPTGEMDLEPEKIDADRLRTFDAQSLERGEFRCGVAARFKGSTQVVAYTAIRMSAEPGDAANQLITIVAPAHRGHKLGMRIKLENHRRLQADRPAVRWVYTGNADGNAPMLGINKKLGFSLVDGCYEYQKDVAVA